MTEIALLKFFFLIWLARWANSQTRLQPGGGGAPSTGPVVTPGAPPGAMPAAPAPWPSTLPPFPSGWEYDNPVPPEVQSRAAALLNQLWARGAGSTAQEMTGGRWITYEAELVKGGSKGVTAWRVKGSPPAPAPAGPPGSVVVPTVPGVVPVATPGAQPPAVTPMQPAMTPLQAAAVAMSNALNANGYRKSDQPLYRAFQAAAGQSNPDGFPGTGTMGQLKTALDSLSLPMPNVTVFPWKAAPGYDGTNAPTLAQWNR